MQIDDKILPDDDLIVEVEEMDDDLVPTLDDDLVEDFEWADPNLEVGSLPSEIEAENDAEIEDREAPERPQRQERREQRQERRDSSVDEAHQRAAAAEAEARQVRAQAIMDRAHAQAAVAENQRASIGVGLDALKGRLDIAYQQLAYARNAGDGSSEIEIQRAIDDIKAAQGDLNNRLREIPDGRDLVSRAEAQARQVANQVPAGKRVGAGVQARTPLAERFAQQNPWMQSNGTANQFLINQSVAMTRDGWDTNSPGFFAELARRVKSQYPHLKVAAPNAQKRTPGRAGVKAPVAPVGSSSGVRAASQSGGKDRYKLTATDQTAMKRMNLNPADKKHRLYFAKSRLERQRAESNNR